MGVPKALSLFKSLDLERKAVSGLGIQAMNGEQIFFEVVTGLEFTQPAGALVGVVQVPAHNGDVSRLGDVPKTGLDGVNSRSGAFRHDGQVELVALGKDVGHLTNHAGGCLAIDRYTADESEKPAHGPEKRLLFNHNVAFEPCDAKANKGPHCVHETRMGKTDDHMLVGKIRRQRLEIPTSRPEKKSSHQAQQGLHIISFILIGSKRMFIILYGSSPGYNFRRSEEQVSKRSSLSLSKYFFSLLHILEYSVFLG